MAAGEFDADGRLPSVRSLCRRFEVSANTVANALSRLAEAGLCTPRAGLGVFLRRPACVAVVGEGTLAIQVSERLAATGYRVRQTGAIASLLDPAPLLLAHAGEGLVQEVAQARRQAGLATVAGGCCLPPDLPCTTVDLDWFRLGYQVARARHQGGRSAPSFAPRRDLPADRRAVDQARAGAFCAQAGQAGQRQSTLLLSTSPDEAWAAPAIGSLADHLAAAIGELLQTPSASCRRVRVSWPEVQRTEYPASTQSEVSLAPVG
ncbi:MAG: GntR family transcriptional regulator [Planctomycetes bacterium]|nr:GntR family transcriptional regulator [Planctomycetota bacterium]